MTVRMQTIKNQNDVPQALQGIVSFQVLDNAVEAVVVKVGEDYIRISKSDNYSSNLKVVKEQPKVVVKRFVLEGKLLGIADVKEVKEVFEKETDAIIKLRHYEQKAGYPETLGLAVVEVEMLVDAENI